jgi:hypothetical protein
MAWSDPLVAGEHGSVNLDLPRCGNRLAIVIYSRRSSPTEGTGLTRCMKSFIEVAHLPVHVVSTISRLISPSRRIHMLRLVLSAVALAGVLAAAQPAIADPLAATASDHAKVAATEQPASPAPASSWSSDASAPGTDTEQRKDFIPVGFGWG